MTALVSGESTFIAPAKLNLFLHVTGRRADGYHLLQTVFTFLDVGDALHIEARDDEAIRRLGADYAVPVPEDSDLVVRAARLLQQETGVRRGANIRIEKRLPMGGGLGGGSSDAATTLLALNRLWGTGLSRPDLQALGLRLGADVPVFIFGHAAWAEGVGEVLHAIDLEEFHALVVVPPEGVPTPLIFASPDLTRDTLALKMASFPEAGLGMDSAERQKRFLVQVKNDLQPVAVRVSASVATHLSALDAVSEASWFGAAGQGNRARMTGSGACVFALFDTREQATAAQRRLPTGMKSFVARGLNRHPHADLV